MGNYVIKTEKHNIFKGTRAEAIMQDLGTKKRVVCGKLSFVLPALSTIKDIDFVYPANKNVDVAVVMDTLEPGYMLQQMKTEEEFYYDFLQHMGVSVGGHPGANSAIIVMNMTKDYFKTRKKFNDEKEFFVPGLQRFLRNSEQPKIFVCGGDTKANPEAEILTELKPYADMIFNSKGHNAFFNSYLEEALEDLGVNEVVLVGADLADEGFYTTIGAVDLDKKPRIKILPQYWLSSADKINRKRGENILKRHFEDILKVGVVYDPGYFEPGRGITIYLEGGVE